MILVTSPDHSQPGSREGVGAAAVGGCTGIGAAAVGGCTDGAGEIDVALGGGSGRCANRKETTEKDQREGNERMRRESSRPACAAAQLRPRRKEIRQSCIDLPIAGLWRRGSGCRSACRIRAGMGLLQSRTSCCELSA